MTNYNSRCHKCGTPIKYKKIAQHKFGYCTYCEIWFCPRCRSPCEKREYKEGTNYSCSNPTCRNSIWIGKTTLRSVGIKIGFGVLLMSLWVGFASIIQSFTNNVEVAWGLGMLFAIICIVVIGAFLGLFYK